MTSGAGIRVEAEATLSALRTAVEAASNARPLYDEIGASLVVSTEMRFEREQSPEGAKWPPSIRALATGGRTLTDSARLVQSITHEASETGVVVGTNVLYAAIHQFGGTIRAKTPKGLVFKVPGGGAGAENRKGAFRRKQQVTLPARPFLGLDEDDATEIVAIAEDWLARSIAPDVGTGAV